MPGKLVGWGAVLLAALLVGVGGAAGHGLATPTTLLVEVSGVGSVTGGGGQIGCGAGQVACYATYVTGSSVTISAAADSGWSFDSWSGCNTQSATTCTVNLDGGDHTVTVSFAPNVAPGDSTLTVSAPTDASGNGGNVTAGDEIDCGSDGTDDCSWTDYTGSTVTVVEEPDVGYAFSGWGGACSGTATSCTVSLANDESITATFTRSSSSPTLSVAVTGNGTVSGGGIACTSAGGSGCTTTESAGSTVTLTATPGAGSGFSGWGGACAGTAVSCVVTMDVAKNVTAAFGGGSSSSTYPLVVAVVGNGTVTGGGISCGSSASTCTASPAAGSQVRLTAKAAGGESFTGWSGACSGHTATCTLTMNAAKNVTATFTGATSGGGGGGGGAAPALTVSVSGPGRVTGAGLACGNGAQTCSTSVTAGLAVTLTATPASGATFAGWGGPCHGTSRLCHFVATADTSIVATFRGAGGPSPAGRPAPRLRSLARPLVQRTETGYAVTLRFRMARRSSVRVRALRAGRAEASFSFTGAAGADEVGPFPLTKTGFYRFEVTVAGGSLHWTACLGLCGERASAVAFAFGRRPPDVKRSGARWSVALRFRSTVPAGVDVRVYRSGNLAHEARFPVRAGVAAARPLLLAPGSYAFKVTATDAYGRIRLLTWIVVLP